MLAVECIYFYISKIITISNILSEDIQLSIAEEYISVLIFVPKS